MIDIVEIDMVLAKANRLRLEPLMNYGAPGETWILATLWNGELPIINWPGDGSRKENIIGAKYLLPANIVTAGLADPTAIEDYVLTNMGLVRA